MPAEMVARATRKGTELLKAFLGAKLFDYPKSLYAVEDAIRLFTREKSNAVVLDFFCGSGTTAHAVMRLNRQDSGRRQSISITNNEVRPAIQSSLRAQGLRPGDRRWEDQGIAFQVTRARIEAAATGVRPNGSAVPGAYKFVDEFPCSEGFDENLEFFDLTYEAPLRVASNREFTRVAPLLWMRAGANGRRIDDIAGGWDVADAYGVIADFDDVGAFLDAMAKSPDATHAFVVTDDDWLFQSVCHGLPEHVEPVRLYEAYLRNFEFEAGGGAR